MDRTQHQSYEPWNVGVFPKGHSDLESLVDGDDGVKIRLIFHDTDQIVTVKFAFPDVYRVIDEGYRAKQLEHLPPMGETMYIVSHSDIVEALVDEACGLLKAEGVIHYFIATDNDCIDVIARTVVKPELESKQ